MKINMLTCTHQEHRDFTNSLSKTVKEWLETIDGPQIRSKCLENLDPKCA
jgi:hemerythrin-like domain-containing protein